MRKKKSSYRDRYWYIFIIHFLFYFRHMMKRDLNKEKEHNSSYNNYVEVHCSSTIKSS